MITIKDLMKQQIIPKCIECNYVRVEGHWYLLTLDDVLKSRVTGTICDDCFEKYIKGKAYSTELE